MLTLYFVRVFSDINECVLDTGINEYGNVYFIDPCSVSNVTNSICSNIDGGYKCICDLGFRKVNGLCIEGEWYKWLNQASHTKNNSVGILQKYYQDIKNQYKDMMKKFIYKKYHDEKTAVSKFMIKNAVSIIKTDPNYFSDILKTWHMSELDWTTFRSFQCSPSSAAGPDGIPSSLLVNCALN